MELNQLIIIVFFVSCAIFFGLYVNEAYKKKEDCSQSKCNSLYPCKNDCTKCPKPQCNMTNTEDNKGCYLPLIDNKGKHSCVQVPEITGGGCNTGSVNGSYNCGTLKPGTFTPINYNPRSTQYPKMCYSQYKDGHNNNVCVESPCSTTNTGTKKDCGFDKGKYTSQPYYID